MEILPILSAMRRNKVGAILVAVQMAVTLAILCNALFIIQQRLAASSRPSGVEEASLFAISNQWIGNPPDETALLETDLATLRSLSGVADAYATNSYPLTDSGWGDGASVKPDAPHGDVVHLARYFGDEHLINTLGVKLVAGRNFAPDEVRSRGYNDRDPPSAVILTRAAAEALFPQGDALGKTIYTGGSRTKASPVVGIVDRLQVPWVGSDSWASSWVENSVIEPYHYLSKNFFYLVRVQPGQLDRVIRESQQKLFEVHRARVIDKVQTLTEARRSVYRDDRGLALILGVVCTVLLAVTAFGIVGLTSYWVAQRRRQIGIRRALGATRGAVVRYFQTENLMIAATGAVVGIALAITLNLWMVSNYQLQRLDSLYTVVGAVAVLLLGQVAVLWPALRAASIPPALATRSV